MSGPQTGRGRNAKGSRAELAVVHWLRDWYGWAAERIRSGRSTDAGDITWPESVWVMDVKDQQRWSLGVVGFDPRAESAPAVLAEREGVRGDPAPRREAGQAAAGTLGGGTPGRGWSDDTDRMTFLPMSTGTITANWSKGPGNTRVEEGHVIPFHPTQDPISSDDGTTHCMGTEPTGSIAVADDLAVRRLTPTECERLMGWPDGHTEPAGADSHRYRLCGNGVIAPAAEWLARRIDAADRSAPVRAHLNTDDKEQMNG